MSFLSCIVFLFYLYCLVNLALRCLLRLLLESVEEHYHISIVEDEEHTEDVAAMFGTEFLIWFFRLSCLQNYKKFSNQATLKAEK